MSKPELIRQPSVRPTRKVQQGALYGGVSVAAVNAFVMFAVNRYYHGAPPADVLELVPWIVGFLVWVVTVAGAYFSKERAELCAPKPENG